MANLKALRSRIRTVQETKKITTAMMLVSGSKLRRAQKDLEEARPFIDNFHAMLEGFSFLLPGEQEENLLLKGYGREDTVLVLVMSSDRGLCGSFNIAIVREVIKTLSVLKKENKKILLLPLGRKGRELLRYKNENLFVGPDFLSSNFFMMEDFFEKSAVLALDLIAAYRKGMFDKCLVFYTQFHTVLRQNVVSETVLPVPCTYKTPKSADALYAYEPTLSSFGESFLPDYIAARFYNMLLQSSVSEQGARMMAMDGATRNAKDMIQRLQLVYNRSRQATITKELIEIISGAEALK